MTLQHKEHRYVTGPAKIDHVSRNYIEFYFANVFHSECSIPYLSATEESPLNSAVVVKILLW